jgi:hypothetical protein
MVNYAKEYGIDIEELQLESPSQPRQARLRREREAMAADYWQQIERVNELAAVGITHAKEAYEYALANPPKSRVSPAKPQPRVSNQKLRKPRPKTFKVGRYDFTEKQFEIALEVLEKQREEKRAKK